MRPQELIDIVKKFAESGWDVIEAPAKKWLGHMECKGCTEDLVDALRQADSECGSCGCEFDPLYKKALELLA